MKVKQALLTDGVWRWYTWIPSELAKVGLELKTSYGREWTVKEAYTVEDEKDLAYRWSIA